MKLLPADTKSGAMVVQMSKDVKSDVKMSRVVQWLFRFSTHQRCLPPQMLTAWKLPMNELTVAAEHGSGRSGSVVGMGGLEGML